MAATSHHWVCTDRRTDAEILKEIARADSQIVIVSRDRQENWASIPSYTETLMHAKNLISQDSISLQAPSATDKDLALEFTSSWVTNLSFFVTPPSSFGCIVISQGEARSLSPRSSDTSLWEWIVRLHAEGACVIRSTSKALETCRPLGEKRNRPLIPRPSREMSKVLRRQIEDLGGIYFTGEPDDVAMKAGLFQWHDALNESHECSQSIEGQGKHRAGDYWHAIMHRREPDYGNSKYWFRRVGRHPIFAELGRRAEPWIMAAAPEWKDRLLQDGWDPFAFVDFCETVADGKPPPWITVAEQIQELEMLLLLDSTYQDARSG